MTNHTPDNTTKLIAAAKEAISILEDFGGWSSSMLKEIYGTKRKHAGIIKTLTASIDAGDYNALVVTATDVANSLEAFRDEMQDGLDNTPESFHDTDNYYQREEAVDVLDSAYTALDEVLKELNPDATDKVKASSKTKTADEVYAEWEMEQYLKAVKDLERCYDMGVWNTEEYTEKMAYIISKFPDSHRLTTDWDNHSGK